MPIFPIWKPVGPTSFDIVSAVRRATGEKTVGHAGTLDPLASGVLVVGVGREATKKLHEVVAGEKEYRAVIRLGMFSATDDAEGEKTEVETSVPPTQAELEAVLKRLTGSVLQRPPAYSALKIRGKPAYARVRRGESVVMSPRPVEVKKIDLIAYTWPEVTLQITTGPGVYIRAIARDLGEALKTGGYLKSLERTRVGQFTQKDCVEIQGLQHS